MKYICVVFFLQIHQMKLKGIKKSLTTVMVLAQLRRVTYAVFFQV